MKVFDTRQHRERPDHRDRRARRAAVDHAQGAARHRLPRRRQEEPAHLRVFHILGPSVASLDEIAETSGFMGDAQLFPGEELHQQHDVLRVGSGDLQLLFQEDQRRPRDHHSEAQRDGLRAGRACVGAVRVVRREQGHGRPGRQLFLRAARLCPALARQRVGRVRPREAQRHRRPPTRRARTRPPGRNAPADIHADRRRPNGTPNADLHHLLAAAARRQDAARAHARRILPQRGRAGRRLRLQSRRVRAGRLPARLHRGRQHRATPRARSRCSTSCWRTTACPRWSTSATRCSTSSSP